MALSIWFACSLNFNSKFYGYGNNKYGQLGLIDIKYTKIPKKLEIPEKEIKNNNDFVIKIICSNTISVLITYKGKIYVCGNFNPKDFKTFWSKTSICF